MFHRVKICSTLLLLYVAGCAGHAPEADDTEKSQHSRVGVTSQTNQVKPGERWDAIYLKDSKVGYQHTTIDFPDTADRDLLRIRSTMLLTFVRFGQETEMKVDLESLERSDGQLVGFHCSQGTNAASNVTEGEVENGKLHLKSTNAGRTTTETIAWEPSWGGMFAIDSSLMREPMEPGEKRDMRILMPITFGTAEVDLHALDFEETELLGEKRKLLKIAIVYTIGTVKIDEFRWVDANGELWKSTSPQTQQSIYRTSRTVALGDGDGTVVDIAELNNVRVNRRLADPHGTQRIVYRARVESGDLKNVFARGASQQVRLIDDRTAEITVRAISPSDPPELQRDESAPDRADREPNGMIQSDDAMIRQIAASVEKEETDPWKIALGMERHVKEYITESNFSKAFDSAAAVAENRTGDCTEHAVLLAALCRARRIPARVAIGLVYLPTQQAGTFAYHMWDEVWIGDRWIPLDATLARGGIGAAHIKLTTSSLDGVSPESAFLPVVQVVGRLKLDLVEVD